MTPTLHEISGIVSAGHGVASGRSVGLAHNPYPAGTIAMQAPFFEQHGIDLSGLRLATLNLDIAPCTWLLLQPDHRVEQLAWTHLHPPETFSFVRLQVLWQDQWQAGWLYLPHPETKAAHFQRASIMELILPPLQGIKTGDTLKLQVQQAKLAITQPSG